jgi:Na+(H+)/acetate symporter ActP
MEPIRNPVYWAIAFIILFYIFSLFLCYLTLRKLKLEKERIIGERNALQEIVLGKARLTSGRE